VVEVTELEAPLAAVLVPLAPLVAAVELDAALVPAAAEAPPPEVPPLLLSAQAERRTTERASMIVAWMRRVFMTRNITQRVLVAQSPVIGDRR
jgi:hypothetical protein